MSNLRKRTVANPDEGSAVSTLIESFKGLDAYAKPLDDFKVKTSSGASITLVSAFFIVLLLISEFVDWRSVKLQPHIDVDKARNEKMTINMNITFPHIPCFLLSLDVMDIAGEHQNDVSHNVYKVRLSPDGSVINKSKGVVGEHDGGNPAPKDPNYCGSCYGGIADNEKGCCNTCDDVRRAYEARGWTLSNPDAIEQCVNEHYSEKIKEQSIEGCNVHGHIEVNKVPGNVHFAPGRPLTQARMHVHDLSQYSVNENFNFGHIIHSLSFGEEIHYLKNPLDNTSKLVSHSHYTFQYFVKVVSTKFELKNGSKIATNQFSITENDMDTTAKAGMPQQGYLPGVFFNYDISPMLITYVEYQKPFAHFLTDVCAIVGGIFTVAGIVDSFVYKAEKSFKRKVELGKGS
ncbi:endoplasmic reticulum vesicle transporter-domain-containing protein [Polychytrium aggregatum]|uniref:endoplasmic reticulum vesicle transporter-domain-containing protein n=1 Tax=Polychytrium aggregatum TaxID=110093 RepID=UPI0022FDF4AB|nr:endoplasmic reticulum vesicle transporter-domain-containing protein [Polychytrium aggregatum]KAI9193660.1 endoplasmic reticulum vesicle transporter-domain-containing protein [Polychytrium aggregatum]